MLRLIVHVEGQTEETFVNEVLAPYLGKRGYSSVSARLIGGGRQKATRGGIRSWKEVRRGIVNHLKADGKSLATIMVDYYGMPAEGSRAWPGRGDAAGGTGVVTPGVVDEALRQDVIRCMPPGFDPSRFVPFVLMHEFEALLFSDCRRFAIGINKPEMEAQFQTIRDAFASPEEIDDSPSTAPSKRIEALVPGYQKPLLGTLAALEIGINRMRRECPHFRAWLTQLDELSAKMASTTR